MTVLNGSTPHDVCLIEITVDIMLTTNLSGRFSSFFHITTMRLRSVTVNLNRASSSTPHVA
jgi:hypothetical protein